MTILILITVQYSYTKIGKGIQFFPEVEPDLSKIVIYARGNLSVEEKNFYQSVIGNFNYLHIIGFYFIVKYI